MRPASAFGRLIAGAALVKEYNWGSELYRGSDETMGRSFHEPMISMKIAGTQRSAENSRRHIHCTREASFVPVIANAE
jgi:hypothetical protein